MTVLSGVGSAPPLPPPRVFWGVSSFQALAWFRRGLFYSYLAVYLRQFLGLSITETTLFATLPMVANILFQTFLWGPLSDRSQRRRSWIVLGEVLAGFGTLGVWYLHRWLADPRAAGYAIIFGLTLVEIFWSMSNINWSALISDLYPEKWRNAVQGHLTAIGGFGRIAGVWIGGLLYDGFGRHFNGWGFEQGSLFFVAAAAMFISTIPLIRVPQGGVDRKVESTAAHPARETLRTPVGLFIFFLVAMVLVNFGRNGIAVIITPYLVLENGFAVSSRALSYIVNTQSGAMILAGVLAAPLSLRWGDGKSLLLGTAAAIASLFLMATGDQLWLMYLANFLRGLSETMILAASYAIASVLIPAQWRGRLFGYFNATFFLSWGLAGTLMAGPIADALIDAGHSQVFAYRAAFMSAFAMTLAGLIVMIAVLVKMRRYRHGHR